MAPFRVMTWNVENLFDVGDEDGPATEADLAAKIESLRAVIDAQRPDVAALQEVGPENVVERLQRALMTPMPHRELGIADGRGIRVGFISRLPLRDRVDIGPFPAGLLPIQVGDDPAGPAGPQVLDRMGRGALRVTLTTNSREVHVVAAHLKSKLLTFPGGFQPANEDQRARFASYALYRRASEATTLRTHLDGLLQGGGRTMAVILAGDMNDEVNAATTQILNGPPGSEIETAGFARADRGDGDRMFNLAPRILPAERRFSRVFRGRPELIDHIFVSHFLASAGRTIGVTTVSAEAVLPSIVENPAARRGEPGSDHAAVVATFDF